MIRTTVSAGALLLSCTLALPATAQLEIPTVSAQPVRAQIIGEEVKVLVGEAVFTAYKFSPAQKYPYFYPVNGPESEVSLTTESSEPYPHHHSLFFGCDHVNGGNYWQDINARGQIVSQGPRITDDGPERVVIEDTCLWQREGQAPILREERLITITAPNTTTRFIDFDTTLHPMVNVVITKTNHSLFSARMRPALSVESGGTILNADGGKNAEGTFGIESPWCDYYGSEAGSTEGLAIFQHPENPWFPSKWFTRDYGFFSPTELNWLEEYRIAKDRPLRLRYRVVAHAGDTDAAGIDAHFRKYATARNPSARSRAPTRRIDEDKRASPGRPMPPQPVSRSAVDAARPRKR